MNQSNTHSGITPNCTITRSTLHTAVPSTKSRLQTAFESSFVKCSRDNYLHVNYTYLPLLWLPWWSCGRASFVRFSSGLDCQNWLGSIRRLRSPHWLVVAAGRLCTRDLRAALDLGVCSGKKKGREAGRVKWEVIVFPCQVCVWNLQLEPFKFGLGNRLWEI